MITKHNTKPYVSFIGLGTMGFPMAGHIAQHDYHVTVYNRNRLKAETWQTHYSGEVAKTLTEAVALADIVLTCVGNDDDVREIYSAMMHKAKPGCIFVDHTTTSAQLARELDRQAKNKGLAFIDAPVSGGQAGAEQRYAYHHGRRSTKQLR